MRKINVKIHNIFIRVIPTISVITLLLILGVMLYPISLSGNAALAVDADGVSVTDGVAEKLATVADPKDLDAWIECYDAATDRGLPSLATGNIEYVEDGSGKRVICNENASLVNGTTYTASSTYLSFSNVGNSVILQPGTDGVARGRININADVRVEHSSSFALYYSTESSELIGTQNNINTGDRNKIVSLLEDTSFSQIPNDTWGIAVSAVGDPNDAAYKQVTGELTKIPTADPIDGTADVNLAISIATAVSSVTPKDYYTNTLTISLVSQPETVTKFGDVTTMQELATKKAPNGQTYCEQAEINDTAYLRDERDDNYYWVTKLADGNCWMSQNLALNLYEGKDINKSVHDKDADGNILGSSLVAGASANDYVPEATTIKTHTESGEPDLTAYTSVNSDHTNSIYSWSDGLYVVIKPEGAHSRSQLFASMDQGGMDAWSADNFLNDDENTIPADVNFNGYAGEVDPVSSRTRYGVVMRVENEDDKIWEPATDPNFTVSSSYIQNGISCNKTPGWAVDVNKCGDVYVYDAHYLVGNYYQWFTATSQRTNAKPIGKNNIAPLSICPSGWKLPRAGLTDALMENGSFYYMLSQYGGISARNLVLDANKGATRPYTFAAADNITETPLFLTRFGMVDPGNNILRGVGMYGSPWSAVMVSGTAAYYLYFDHVGVYTSAPSGVTLGQPVRCLLTTNI